MRPLLRGPCASGGARQRLSLIVRGDNRLERSDRGIGVGVMHDGVTALGQHSRPRGNCRDVAVERFLTQQGSPPLAVARRPRRSPARHRVSFDANRNMPPDGRRARRPDAERAGPRSAGGRRGQPLGAAGVGVVERRARRPDVTDLSSNRAYPVGSGSAAAFGGARRFYEYLTERTCTPGESATRTSRQTALTRPQDRYLTQPDTHRFGLSEETSVTPRWPTIAATPGPPGAQDVLSVRDTSSGPGHGSGPRTRSRVSRGETHPAGGPTTCSIQPASVLLESSGCPLFCWRAAVSTSRWL